MPCLLYLGTHMPNWLWNRSSLGPLFVSAHRLAGRKSSFPRATVRWVLDSGGFSQLARHGRWITPAVSYASLAVRCRDQVGSLEWACCQDWVCAPDTLKATGLTVLDHQHRTVESYLELTRLVPDLVWAPVLQGLTATDYLHHVQLHERAGIVLQGLPVVAVGGVAARQHTSQAASVFRELSQQGLRLHGLGIKFQGLARYADTLVSADSMAWSYHGRRLSARGAAPPNSANDQGFAEQWRAQVNRRIQQGDRQLGLWQSSPR